MKPYQANKQMKLTLAFIILYETPLKSNSMGQKKNIIINYYITSLNPMKK